MTEIELGQYYEVETLHGTRTTKCTEPSGYGIYSASNYELENDGQGIMIPDNSTLSNNSQVTAFNNWYNG